MNFNLSVDFSNQIKRILEDLERDCRLSEDIRYGTYVGQLKMLHHLLDEADYQRHGDQIDDLKIDLERAVRCVSKIIFPDFAGQMEFDRATEIWNINNRHSVLTQSAGPTSQFH